MNDNRIRLEQLLGELRAQLAASSTVDAPLRRRLEQTLSEVQQALSTPGGLTSAASASGGSSAVGHSGEPLRKRLSEATIEFEVSHPALAGTLGSLIDALGRMGI